MADQDDAVVTPEKLRETVRKANAAIEDGTRTVEHVLRGSVPGEFIEPALARLKETLQECADANSAFPATAAFLKKRGLEHVNQLDEKGRQELVEHLQSTLAELVAKGEQCEACDDEDG